MPWNYYRRNYRYRRPYWFPRRRARKIIFRRRKRYHRRVRNFKLPAIRLLQWQPPSIRKCHIKGLECILMFNQNRIPFNSNMYRNSFVPPGFPGGGGFTVIKFTLGNLFDMHQYCTNWWTQTNDDLPLCRYLGCKIKCYQSELIDYAIKYSITQPAVSTKLTYPSLQPSMIMMSNQKKIIPSRKTHKRHKPYYTLKIPPPTQLQNKWYFQRDIRETPLLVLFASAISLNQYWIANSSDNNNITIHSLNTQIVKNRNFSEKIWPFNIEGTRSLYLYEYLGNKPHTDPSKFELNLLTPLTDVTDYTIGTNYHEFSPGNPNNWNNYWSNITRYCGNPFVLQHREQEKHWFYSESGPVTIAEKIKTLTSDKTVADVPQLTGGKKFSLSKWDGPLIKDFRYNPFKDKGDTTQMYLVKNNEIKNDWDPPTDPEKILEGFPLWLNIFGFVDFQIRLGAIPNIYTKSILVFKNQTTDPKTNLPIVPLDWDFLNNKSPYEGQVNPADAHRWHPQVQYQTQQINNIAYTGPGTPKQYEKTSDQINIKYDFYFKWGGNPAKMIKVSNPATQIIYPLPSDESQTTSLQNPAQRPESLLYSFDQRYNSLTKQATERISKDWDFTQILSSITETTTDLPAHSTFPKETPQEATSEKEKEEIFQQLIQHKLQQQQLRTGILQLMKQLDL
nr:MAG: ORF1 [TTV-like mini virus]